MDTAVLENEGEVTISTDAGDNKPPPIEVIEPQANTGPTPEQALAASQEAIQRAERDRDAAIRQARANEVELRQARQTQQQDQMAVLASAVEASTAERDQCQREWQAAMEAGDWAKAAEVNTKLAAAETRRQGAARELEIAKVAGPTRQVQQDQPANTGGYSQATRQWIDAHPEFSRSNAVKQALIAKHAELMDDGIQADSRAYFRALDEEYARLTSGGNRQENHMQREQFGGAPPSRGNGGNGGGGSTVQTLLGPVKVSQRNGQTLIEIPTHLRSDFDEGAKIARISTAEYALEQVKIARERASGETGGLITAEGATYR